MLFTKGIDGPKHHKVIAQGLLADHDLFPAGSETPNIPPGTNYHMASMHHEGSSKIASAKVPDPTSPLTKQTTKITTHKHTLEGHFYETQHHTVELTSGVATKTTQVNTVSHSNAGSSMSSKQIKRKKTTGNNRHLLQADLDDDTGYGDEETLSDSQVGVDDNGVLTQASNNINMAAGTNTNIVTGGADANNTAISQTAGTFEVTVSGPAVVGGRRLLEDERKQRLFRLDASGGIHLESKTGMTVQADSVQVTGPLVASTGIEVTGDVALAGNLVIPCGNLNSQSSATGCRGCSACGAAAAQSGMHATTIAGTKQLGQISVQLVAEVHPNSEIVQSSSQNNDGMLLHAHVHCTYTLSVCQCTHCVFYVSCRLT
jgi:hypothetical protein